MSSMNITLGRRRAAFRLLAAVLVGVTVALTAVVTPAQAVVGRYSRAIGALWSGNCVWTPADRGRNVYAAACSNPNNQYAKWWVHEKAEEAFPGTHTGKLWVLESQGSPGSCLVHDAATEQAFLSNCNWTANKYLQWEAFYNGATKRYILKNIGSWLHEGKDECLDQHSTTHRILVKSCFGNPSGQTWSINAATPYTP
ncbi:hypothetical protein OHA21_05580 [Actinoplanes sp. NBC_00393]|uniref:hypothetical protein n=1 Tax=Actinoplanes sp. NBC_00393 TaxID=2975953 RepID=UPI002E217B53